MDTALLREMHETATNYLESFKWCQRIEESYFGLGVGGIVAVLLMKIKLSQENVDELLWVVVRDLPPAYLVTHFAPDTASALRWLNGLMLQETEKVLITLFL